MSESWLPTTLVEEEKVWSGLDFLVQMEVSEVIAEGDDDGVSGDEIPTKPDVITSPGFFGDKETTSPSLVPTFSRSQGTIFPSFVLNF